MITVITSSVLRIIEQCFQNEILRHGSKLTALLRLLYVRTKYFEILIILLVHNCFNFRSRAQLIFTRFSISSLRKFTILDYTIYTSKLGTRQHGFSL